MKKTIITLSALTLVFASCEDYNDQFDIQTKFDDVNEIALTLEKSDYSAIANNKSNLQLAAGLDGETTAYSDALAKQHLTAFSTNWQLQMSTYPPFWQTNIRMQATALNLS